MPWISFLRKELSRHARALKIEMVRLAFRTRLISIQAICLLQSGCSIYVTARCSVVPSVMDSDKLLCSNFTLHSNRNIRGILIRRNFYLQLKSTDQKKMIKFRRKFRLVFRWISIYFSIKGAAMPSPDNMFNSYSTNVGHEYPLCCCLLALRKTEEVERNSIAAIIVVFRISREYVPIFSTDAAARAHNPRWDWTGKFSAVKDELDAVVRIVLVYNEGHREFVDGVSAIETIWIHLCFYCSHIIG